MIEFLLPLILQVKVFKSCLWQGFSFYRLSFSLEFTPIKFLPPPFCLSYLLSSSLISTFFNHFNLRLSSFDRTDHPLLLETLLFGFQDTTLFCFPSTTLGDPFQNPLLVSFNFLSCKYQCVQALYWDHYSFLLHSF